MADHRGGILEVGLHLSLVYCGRGGGSISSGFSGSTAIGIKFWRFFEVAAIDLG